MKKYAKYTIKMSIAYNTFKQQNLALSALKTGSFIFHVSKKT